MRVWREGGPNTRPTWEELHVAGWEASEKPFPELGLAHGDVLVVQEHPSRLPLGIPAAPQWIGRHG